ncbi:MAG: hypothetical protein M3O70_29015 [Actinomycetota bacterium]|nr:hypothetical protein [Actinomycetota bacterium]
MSRLKTVAAGSANGRHPDRRSATGVLLIVPAVVLSLLATAGQAAATNAAHSTSPVVMLPGFDQVGTSTLVRTDHGLSAMLDTTALTPDDVVTLWWIVFNKPAACQHPIPGSACGPGDAHNTAADGPQPSALHAAGRIVGDDGTAAYGAHVRVGDTSRALFGPGLLDARGAHIVLVLKTHGPKVPSLTAEMLRTFAGGCADHSDVPPGAPSHLVGPLGPNDCAEIQFSVHSPTPG